MSFLPHRIRPFDTRNALSKPLLLVALLGGSHAYSASMTWSGAIDNNWDTTTANWTGSTWNNGTPDSAIFDATGVGPINLTTGITAGGITFNTTGYTIAGNTLALSGTVATNANAAINSNISVASSATFNAASDQSLTLGGAVSGIGNLLFNGAGTTTITGSVTSSGQFWIGQTGAATVSISDGAQLGSGTGVGYLAVNNGGTLRYTGTGATSTTNARHFYTNTGAANFDITQAAGKLTIQATSGGTNNGGLFTKSGDGTLTISSTAARTFSQAVSVTGGVLESSINGAVTWSNTGSVSLTGNSVMLYSVNHASAIAVLNNATGASGTAGTTFRVSGAGKLANDSFNGISTGNLASLDVINGATFDVRAKNMSIDALTGTGTVGNSYNQSINVAQNLTIGAANGSGTFSGSIVGNSNGQGAPISSAVTTGALNLIKAGAGTQTLTGANSYRDTTITGGTLSVGIIADAGTSNLGAGSVILNGGKLQYTAVGTTTTTTRAFNANNTTAGSAIEITDAGTTLAINSGFAGHGAGVVIKQGAGTLDLTGSADNSALVLNVAAGTVLFGKSGASIRAVAGITDIATGATVKLTGSSGDQIYGLTTAGTNYGLVNMSGGTLDLFGHSESLNRLTGTGTVTSSTAGAVTLTLGQSNATNTFGGTIQDGSGTVALTKIGTGILTLNGANTYSGATTINAGTLLANNTTDSATGSGTVTVKSTATLGGTGAVSGAVILESGGTLAPGASIESLATGELTLPAGATLAAQIDSSGTPSADVVHVTGDVTLSGTLAVTDIAGTQALVASGTKLTLITYTGTLDGTFDGLEEGATVNVGINSFTIRYADSHAVTLESLAVGGGYSTWAGTNAPGQTANQDYDGDGVSNAVEYVLGGLATTNDAGKLPTISTAGGNLVFTFRRDQDSKAVDTSVIIEVGTTLAAWPLNFTVGNDTAGSTAGVTVSDNLDGTDTVTLTIAQAPDAKKFARLRVAITP